MTVVHLFVVLLIAAFCKASTQARKTVKFIFSKYVMDFQPTYWLIGVVFFLSVWLLSPRNALGRGYSNAAVVLSVRACVCVSVRVSITLWPCEHDRNWTIACLFIKLGRHVHYDERMNPIYFGARRSKVKVRIDIYGNKLVNTIETKPLCASWSNFAHM